MGPLDRRPQRAVALYRGPPASREEPEAVVEQAGDVGGGEALHPRRRQLDRQRHAVEAAADLLDGVRWLSSLERRHDLTGPVPNSSTAAPPAPAAPPATPARRPRRGPLATSPARSPRAARHHAAASHGGVDDVLAVVEDTSDASASGATPRCPRSGCDGGLGHGEGRRDHLGDSAGSSSGASSTSQTPSRSGRRGAAAVWTASRVLPMPPGPTSVTSRWSRTEVGQAGDLVGSANEAGEQDGEVGGGCAERGERGETVVESFCVELEDT